MNRSVVRTLLVVLVVVVLVAGGAGAFIWWKLSTLKQQLLTQLGDSIGAQVQVASIDLDVWKGELRAAGITLTNQRPSAPWEKGDISQATLHFNLRDLFAPHLQVTVEVDSWNVLLHSPLRTAETPPASPNSPSASDAHTSGGSRIDVTQITAREGTVEVDFSDDRKMTVHGVSFDASDNGANIWTTQLQATSLKAENLDVGACSMQLRGEPGKISFSDLHMQCEPGVITGDGNVALDDTHEMQVNLKTVDVPITMLVAAKWQMELSGLVTGELAYLGDDKGGAAKGQIAVSHGKFNVLPWLGKVTSLVGLQDISNVEVDKATTDFAWKDGTMHLTNIDVRKTDVTRIAGTVDVDPTGQVDGRLKLGLPSTITAKWPQLQTQVFPVSLEDYNWADVHLTGTPDHLQEDLTPRLLSAGIGQGGDLLNQAAQKATDLFHSVMGK
jgi:hypothetical protein